MEQTVKKKIGVRDIMTIAAMMVINFAIAMVIGMVTLPFPAVYLYGSAGIDAFIGATFYLVAANRINKHGLLFAWATVYGLIQGVMGYMFLVPYFLIVALIAELCMVGKNTYRSAVRNRIGWMVNSIGNFVGCAVPLWWAWDSYQEMAASSGFDANTLNMQFSMVTSPALMAELYACFYHDHQQHLSAFDSGGCSDRDAYYGFQGVFADIHFLSDYCPCDFRCSE